MIPRNRLFYLTVTAVSDALDVDALDWKARVISNGGSVSNSTLTAASNFVTACKNAGIWTKINRVNLFCGSNLAACLVPLKVGGGSATDANVNFVSGDYNETTGLKGDGSSKYINTGFPADSLPANSTHLAVYNRSSTAALSGFGIGVNGDPARRLLMHFPWSDGVFYSYHYNSDTGRLSAPITGPYGFLIGSRTSNTFHASYRNGVQLASQSTIGGSIPAGNIYLFAYNNSPVGPSSYAPYYLGGYSIGTGLTSDDVTAYTTAMEAFQDALGRGVA